MLELFFLKYKKMGMIGAMFFWIFWPGSVFADLVSLNDIAAEIFSKISMIEESFQESCGVCQKKLISEALDGMDEIFLPNRAFTTDGAVFFEKSESPAMKQVLSLKILPSRLPKEHLPFLSLLHEITVIFRFHTENDHLIGIAPSDFTTKSMADLYSSRSFGQPLKVTFQTISFSYGDRRSISYYPSTRCLEIHCRVLSLK